MKILALTMFIMSLMGYNPEEIQELFKNEINANTRKLKISPDSIREPIVDLFTVGQYLVIQSFMNEKN